LLRRAARHGRLLGINDRFLATLSKTVIQESKDGYPELEDKKDYILKLLTIEEDNFYKTIDQGLSILTDLEDTLVKEGSKTLSGEDAFKLYDTYGFPLDLTREILEEKGFAIDEDGFQKAMNVQRETARSARAVTNYMGADETVYQQLDAGITSVFVGYDNITYTSKITALTTDKEVVDELIAGQNGTLFVEETPFYATSGGQVADTGVITTADAEFEVEDTIKLHGGKIGHVGKVTKGILKLEEKVNLAIDNDKRLATGKNHSATHLLQKALRTVLGSHIEQAGSYVTNERLRFDFTHFSALTKEEISEVEAIVNKEIAAGLPVNTDIMTIDEAKKTGAMALFGEKYGDKVRVVSMGDFSKELCGGTHVKNTGTITAFKIISETGVAAGVRRIEALTADGVFAFYNEIEQELHAAAKTAKTEPSMLSKKIEALQDEIKALQTENEKLKNKLAKDALGDVMNQIVDIKGIKLLAAKVPDVDMNGLRNLGDQLKDKMGEGVIILASAMGSDKVNLIAMSSDAAMAKGAHAGNLIKELAVLVGGGGGGRPNMAQAGGKNPAGIDKVITEAAKVLEGQLK
jgi:alanyl-tRNA synthetase